LFVCVLFGLFEYLFDRWCLGFVWSVYGFVLCMLVEYHKT
jgi:hypothetical protein